MRKRMMVFSLCAGLILIFTQNATASTYTPKYTTIKVGLNSLIINTRPAIPSVILSNKSGFLIGYYDDNREFEQAYAASSESITVIACSDGIDIYDDSLRIFHAPTSLAVIPISLKFETNYTLPDPCYGSNYSYKGGFEFRHIGLYDAMSVVNYISIEEYVKGVIPYEMPPSWPLEALKAQALCARTYVVKHFNKYANEGFDVCCTIYNQEYHGVYKGTYIEAVDEAVEATAGEYILYNNKPIDAVYHASDGGATESSENIWLENLPYLRGKIDPHEKTPDAYKWSVSISPGDFFVMMKKNDSSFVLQDIADIDCTYTPTGNMLSITFYDATGAAKTYTKASCRDVILLKYHTSSQHFYIDKNNDISGNASYTITCTGNGHNVGLSQYGARSMAESNFTYHEIIRFYYTDVTISDNNVDKTDNEQIPEINTIAYIDVPVKSWYYDAVTKVSSAGLFSGTSPTTFSPHDPMTRGMFVTVLGRHSGIECIDLDEYTGEATINANDVNFRSGPDTSYPSIGLFFRGDKIDIRSSSGTWYQVVYNGDIGYVKKDYVALGAFFDVTVDAYYTPYVIWANQHNVINGYDGCFRPDGYLTREAICQILYKYCISFGFDIKPSNKLITFSDHNNISSWALTAVMALSDAGIVSGTGDNMFSPKETCTRAEVAQILTNFMSLMQ